MTPDRIPEERPAAPQGSSLDEFSVFMPPRTPRPRMAARHVLFAGVAGACVLGVGLGLWARPAMNERQAAAATPADLAVKAPETARQLEIVVDDRPAPIGAPLDVLPAKAPTPVATPVAAQAQPAWAPPKPRAKLAPLVVAALPAPAKIAPPKISLPKASKIELAPAAKAQQQGRLKLAKVAHQQKLELAKAEARGRAEARAEAKAIQVAEARDDARKRARLASLVRVVQRILPPRTAPAHKPHAEQAKLDRKHSHKAVRHQAQVERTSLKSRKTAHPAPPPPIRTHAAPAAPPQRPSGLMKVSAPRCANRDPGEAIVCANPSLGAADRQLTRAYQSARAAGVPDAQLRIQQQRWLSARTSAAREAPWAVHDVYLARIAELNGQAREVRGDGY